VAGFDITFQLRCYLFSHMYLMVNV